MLDKNDETKIAKIMVKVVGNALEQIVLPEIQDLKDDVFGLKEDMKIVKEDVSGLKKDMKIVKEDVGVLKEDVSVLREDVSDLQDTTNRVETLAKNEIKYVDSLSDRVLKLETKKA